MALLPFCFAAAAFSLTLVIVVAGRKPGQLNDTYILAVSSPAPNWRSIRSFVSLQKLTLPKAKHNGSRAGHSSIHTHYQCFSVFNIGSIERHRQLFPGHSCKFHQRSRWRSHCCRKQSGFKPWPTIESRTILRPIPVEHLPREFFYNH